MKKIVLKLSYVEILEEEREMLASVIVATSKYELCGPMLVEGMAPESSNSETMSAIALQAYPNPADHSVQIVVPQAEISKQHIVIRNMVGQIVYQCVLGDSELNVKVNTSQFSEGVYLLELRNDQTIIAQEKIIITH